VAARSNIIVIDVGYQNGLIPVAEASKETNKQPKKKLKKE
jgi:hypothetical protein